MVPPIKSVQSIRYLDCLVSSVGPNCSLFEVLGQNELSSLFDVRAFCPFLKFFLFGLFADLKKFSNFNLVIELILRKVSSWFIAELLIIYAIKCVNCRQWSFKIHFFHLVYHILFHLQSCLPPEYCQKRKLVMVKSVENFSKRKSDF